MNILALEGAAAWADAVTSVIFFLCVTVVILALIYFDNKKDK